METILKTIVSMNGSGEGNYRLTNDLTLETADIPEIETADVVEK